MYNPTVRWSGQFTNHTKKHTAQPLTIHIRNVCVCQSTFRTATARVFPIPVSGLCVAGRAPCSFGLGKGKQYQNELRIIEMERKKLKQKQCTTSTGKKKTLKTSVQFNERGYRGIVEAVIPNSVRCHVKSVFQMHDAYYTITNQWYLFCFLCSQKYDKWSWSQYSMNLIDRRMAFISQSNNNHCAHFFRFLHQFIYVNIYYYRQFNITHVSLSICILSYK